MTLLFATIETRDIMVANDETVTQMWFNEPLFSRVMHANDSTQGGRAATDLSKQSKHITINTTHYYMTRVSNWDLNESSRSLFIALSTATASAPAPNASAPEVAGSPAPSPPLMPNGYRPVMANTGNGLATDSPIVSVVKGSHDGRDGKPDSAITTGKYISTCMCLSVLYQFCTSLVIKPY